MPIPVESAVHEIIAVGRRLDARGLAAATSGNYSQRVSDDRIGQGLRLYVYSSGSVAAQRLLFSHTEQGDLTPLFSGYFDTTTGPKVVAESFRNIARFVGEPVESILFLSDHTGEIEAARSAGMQAVWVDRDRVAASSGQPDRIRSFDEIVMPNLGRRESA